jgi:hypothetical protein
VPDFIPGRSHVSRITGRIAHSLIVWRGTS